LHKIALSLKANRWRKKGRLLLTSR